MSMHVVYLKTHDGHDKGKSYFIERTLARRLCRNGIAVPYTQYVEEKARAAAAKAAQIEADKKAKAMALLKKKKEKEREKAVSKKAKKRTKNVKK